MTIVRIRDTMSMTVGGFALLNIPDVPPTPAGSTPPPTEDLVLIAREVVLGGLTIKDRPVTIITERLTQVGQLDKPGLALRHSAPPTDSIHTERGTVEPPKAVVESQRAEPGKDGFALTVYAHTIERSTGISQGQGGGVGCIGRDETRSICQTYPATPSNPCNHLNIKKHDFLEGPPGGPGRDGEKGGAPGAVTIVCVVDELSSAADWRGIGGQGGAGGAGGRPGKGAGFQAPAGDVTDGLPGTTPAPKNAAVTHLAEADWWQAVRNLGYGTEWARFRQRQLAHVHREYRGSGMTGGRSEAFLTEAAAIASLPPAEALFPQTAEAIRDVVDECGVEFDLEIVPEVSLYEGIRSSRAGEVDDALEELTKAGPGQVATARQALTTALNRLRGTGGSYIDQDNRARERREIAAAARTTAAQSVARCADDIDRFFPAGVTVSVPGVAGPVDAASLAAALRGLVGTSGSDGPTGPLPTTSPISALPARPRLAGNRARRAAHGPFEPELFATPQPTTLTLAERAQWPSLTSSADARAVDLAAVTGALRAATGPRMARDLLVELAEAVRTWLLADLRIEQANQAIDAVAAAGQAAATVVGRLATIGDNDFAAAAPVLLEAGGLAADALRFHNQRAERAAKIYTLDDEPTFRFTPFSPISDPDLVALLVDSGSLTILTDNVGTRVKELLTSTARDEQRAYTAQGTFKARADAVAARVVFVAPEAPADPAAHPSSAEAFERLRGNEAAFWFDVALTDVTEPHTDAKVHGAQVTITFDSAESATDLPVRLLHEGFSTQLGLNGAIHDQAALPAEMAILCAQEVSNPSPDDPGTEQNYSVGVTERAAPKVPEDGTEAEPTLAAYGRGVVAGWRFDLSQADVLFDRSTIRRIEIEILHEALQPAGLVNLLRVELATAGLRAGAEARGRITLTGPAPAGGLPLALTSSAPGILQVPATVVVPAGEEQAQFSATALADSGAGGVQLTVRSPDGATRRGRLAVSRAVPAALRTRRLGSDANGSAQSVAVVPPIGSAPARVIATLTPPKASEEVTGPVVAPEVHLIGADLTPVLVGRPGDLPRAVAVDPSRNAAYVVYAFDLAKLDLTTMKTVATANIGLGVASVCCDPQAGVVFVSDITHGRVLVLSADDLSQRQVLGGSIGGQPSPLRGANRMAIGAQGRLYLARGFHNETETEAAVTVLRRQPDGTYTIAQDRNLSGAFVQPVDVAVDQSRSRVYASSLGNPNRPPTLTVLSLTLAELGEVLLPANAHGIAAIEGTGLLWAATQRGAALIDAISLQVLRIEQTGSFPFAVDVDEFKTAYVADASDHTISRVTLAPDIELTRLR